MGKIDTFKVVNERLYAMVFDPGDPVKVNELMKNFSLWTDSEYLTEFFKEKKDLLKNEFWSKNETDADGNPLTIAEAVKRTQFGAKDLFSHLVRVAKGEISSPKLNDLFIDLYDEKDDLLKFDKAKVYGTIRPYWLRIYGIKINDSLFVITGGGIKLVEKMSQCDLLKKELDKFDVAIKFLEHDKDIDGDLEELIDNS